MLIEFSVKNYLCFKDQVTLSMVASPTRKTASNDELEENTFSAEGFSERLLKSCVVYGANGSGKSNLFKAMNFMRSFVISSSKDGQVGEKTGTVPFKLSTVTEKEPSEFEITFICEGKKYRYGFALDGKRVHSEWLFDTQKKESRLFERNDGEFYINKRFKEGRGLKDKTRDNALYLSVAAQFNGEISIRIINWFYNFHIISGFPGIDYLTLFLMEEGYGDEISKFMKFADIGIEALSVIELKDEPLETDDLMEHLKKTGLDKNIIESYWKKLKSEIRFHHKKFDNDNNLIQMEKFSSDEESIGTQSLFSLAGPIIDTLEKGNILVIDELDSSLHFLIIMEILGMFHSSANKGAQLIFNCHNTGLLSNKIFRRDQIYFTEKDTCGASSLYSLFDFKEDNSKIRKDASFGKDYLLGKYGAIPHTGDFAELLLEHPQILKEEDMPPADSYK